MLCTLELSHRAGKHEEWVTDAIDVTFRIMVFLASQLRNTVHTYSVNDPYACGRSKSFFADYRPLFCVCGGNVVDSSSLQLTSYSSPDIRVRVDGTSLRFGVS